MHRCGTARKSRDRYYLASSSNFSDAELMQ